MLKEYIKPPIPPLPKSLITNLYKTSQNKTKQNLSKHFSSNLSNTIQFLPSLPQSFTNPTLVNILSPVLHTWLVILGTDYSYLIMNTLKTSLMAFIRLVLVVDLGSKMYLDEIMNNYFSDFSECPEFTRRIVVLQLSRALVEIFGQAVKGTLRTRVFFRVKLK